MWTSWPSITQVLVNQRAALAETLDVAPLALGNLQNAYNAASGTLDTRANINELNQPPIVLICKLVQQATPNNVPPVLAQTCKQLEPILTGAVPLHAAAEVLSDLNAGKLPLPLPLAGVPQVRKLRRRADARSCWPGCGSGGFDGVYDLPLPGGADLGDHPYRVNAQFEDVLDLVPQAGVKVNDVPVGRVERIDLAQDGWTAEVTVLVNGDVELPANAFAKLRQSSLLGEKFVELAQPEDASGQARRRRGDPARPDQPQPRGRRGLRRAVAAAQRRRRRAAAEHHQGAQRRAGGQRAGDPLAARQPQHARRRRWTSTRRRSSARSTGEPARRHARAAAGQDRGRAQRPRARACRCWPSSARSS